MNRGYEHEGYALFNLFNVQSICVQVAVADL